MAQRSAVKITPTAFSIQNLDDLIRGYPKTQRFRYKIGLAVEYLVIQSRLELLPGY